MDGAERTVMLVIDRKIPTYRNGSFISEELSGELMERLGSANHLGVRRLFPRQGCSKFPTTIHSEIFWLTKRMLVKVCRDRDYLMLGGIGAQRLLSSQNILVRLLISGRRKIVGELYSP